MATFTGTSGADKLVGTRRADTIDGRGGNDELYGGRSNDTLIGGTGNDVLYGGAGSDIFSYPERGFGADVIKDFGTGDRVSLSYLNVGDFDTLKPYLTNTPDGAQITLRWNGSSE
ncbi:M10 family metallopeptidase C-terminal domain-containing protein, partial [Methylopila musalis]